jgi:hypothetical protein
MAAVGKNTRGQRTARGSETVPEGMYERSLREREREGE